METGTGTGKGTRTGKEVRDNGKGLMKGKDLGGATSAAEKTQEYEHECAYCGTVHVAGHASFKRCSRCKLVR